MIMAQCIMAQCIMAQCIMAHDDALPATKKQGRGQHRLGIGIVHDTFISAQAAVQGIPCMYVHAHHIAIEHLIHHLLTHPTR